MLTADIKINGCLIEHIYILNKRQVGEDSLTEYTYEFYSVGHGKKGVKSGKVWHKRNEGAERLLLLVLEDILKVGN